MSGGINFKALEPKFAKTAADTAYKPDERLHLFQEAVQSLDEHEFADLISTLTAFHNCRLTYIKVAQQHLQNSTRGLKRIIKLDETQVALLNKYPVLAASFGASGHVSLNNLVEHLTKILEWTNAKFFDELQLCNNVQLALTTDFQAISTALADHYLRIRPAPTPGRSEAAHEQEIESLTARLQDTQVQLEDAKSTIAQHANELSEAQTKNRELEAKVKDLEASSYYNLYTRRTTDCRQLQAQLLAKEAEIASLKQQLAEDDKQSKLRMVINQQMDLMAQLLSQQTTEPSKSKSASGPCAPMRATLPPKSKN